MVSIVTIPCGPGAGSEIFSRTTSSYQARPIDLPHPPKRQLISSSVISPDQNAVET